MNETRKNALILGAIGLVSGAAVGAIILLFSKPEAFSDPALTLGVILDLLFSGLNGAVCMGTTVVYSFDHWSVARATVTHFCIAFGSIAFFYAIGVLLGWMAVPSVGGILILLAVCIVVYFTIWFTHYIRYKKEVRKLNEDLEKMKKQAE